LLTLAFFGHRKTEFGRVADLFGLRPKVEHYGDALFAVFKSVAYVEHEELIATSEVVSTGEIMVFAGPDFVVTVRYGRQGSLGPLRWDLEADAEQLAKGPAAVLHAIADHVVDDYLTVTDTVQDDIDQVETDVFSPHSRQGTDPGRINQDCHQRSTSAGVAAVAEHHSQTGFGSRSPGRRSSFRRINVPCRMGSSSSACSSQGPRGVSLGCIRSQALASALP
jgi:Mg2+ and Co2+ transporter CorA